MKADRDINKLTPEFKEKVERFLAHCHGNGLNIFITEAFRTKERQEYLYASGRTREGAIVTWTLNSVHRKGKAIDIAFNGKELYPSDQEVWRMVADIAKGYGIDWGYDLWHTDKPHFQDNGQPLPDEEKLTQYIMDKQFQDAIQNKICDSMASSASALWNFVSEEEQEKVARIKQEILSLKN